MQNPPPQTHASLQYFPSPPTIKILYPTLQTQIIDQEITQILTTKFAKRALRFTTRLNAFQNRITALEKIVLYGRLDTCTIDTLTSRRMGNLKRKSRRRSRRSVSAEMLDVGNVRSRDGLTPRTCENEYFGSIEDKDRD